jgi:hypothetical protein
MCELRKLKICCVHEKETEVRVRLPQAAAHQEGTGVGWGRQEDFGTRCCFALEDELRGGQGIERAQLLLRFVATCACAVPSPGRGGAGVEMRAACER